MSTQSRHAAVTAAVIAIFAFFAVWGVLRAREMQASQYPSQLPAAVSYAGQTWDCQKVNLGDYRPMPPFIVLESCAP